MRKYALLLLPLIAACVPPAPPPFVAAAQAPDVGAMWDVTRITCGQMLGADDDDRAAGIMFYYGYLAALSGIKVIDVSQIDQNVRRVMDTCVKSPNLTVPQAYDVAFGRTPRPY